MPNLGAPEILMIVLVALVVFGPRKLPELGKSVGHALREFRRSTSSVTEELRAELKSAEPKSVGLSGAQLGSAEIRAPQDPS